MDLSGEGAFERARESGIFERKCHEFVRFVVRKLYEIEEKRAPER
jgi:hypothetical protein